MILLIGGVVAALDFNPVEVIKLAQVSNAIFLPIIVFIIIGLKYEIDNRKLSSSAYQILSFLVFGLSLLLSIAALYNVFGL